MTKPSGNISITNRKEGGIMGALVFVAPLLLVDFFLLAAAHLWADMQYVQVQNSYGTIYRAIIFPIIFLGCLAAILLLESALRAKRFVENETGQVNLRALWNSGHLEASPLTGILITLTMGIGVTNASHLSEIYRLTAKYWLDEKLWKIEAPIFTALLESCINVPLFWDKIYFFIWPALFMVMAIIYKFGYRHQFLKIALAVIIAFHIARVINLFFPTAGPVFFKPELFSIEGTLSVKAQEVLRLYMLGHVSQNGLIPGTMAMPSLHVGLAAMTVWVVACQWRWTLWLTVPWLLLTWLSTIMLGWHYALDGIGGILVTGFSIFIAHCILKAWDSVTAAFHEGRYRL